MQAIDRETEVSTMKAGKLYHRDCLNPQQKVEKQMTYEEVCPKCGKEIDRDMDTCAVKAGQTYHRDCLQLFKEDTTELASVVEKCGFCGEDIDRDVDVLSILQGQVFHRDCLYGDDEDEGSE